MQSLLRRFQVKFGQLNPLSVAFDERGAQIQVTEEVEQALLPRLGWCLSQQSLANLPMLGCQLRLRNERIGCLLNAVMNKASVFIVLDE